MMGLHHYKVLNAPASFDYISYYSRGYRIPSRFLKRAFDPISCAHRHHRSRAYYRCRRPFGHAARRYAVFSQRCAKDLCWRRPPIERQNHATRGQIRALPDLCHPARHRRRLNAQTFWCKRRDARKCCTDRLGNARIRLASLVGRSTPQTPKSCFRFQPRRCAEIGPLASASAYSGHLAIWHNHHRGALGGL